MKSCHSNYVKGSYANSVHLFVTKNNEQKDADMHTFFFVANMQLLCNKKRLNMADKHS